MLFCSISNPVRDKATNFIILVWHKACLIQVLTYPNKTVAKKTLSCLGSQGEQVRQCRLAQQLVRSSVKSSSRCNWIYRLSAIPCPSPTIRRPPMKAPTPPRGAKHCMKVAIMTRIHPVDIPALRPAKSAIGPPKKKPPKTAPTLFISALQLRQHVSSASSNSPYLCKMY